ncbi:MAG: ATP-binding cassette domain-containing protein, partial [Bifidobacteriaceae bacterium]|nr:ATP-binding cassette domain-containing protein [Bifidobacteriaceae bacterium]
MSPALLETVEAHVQVGRSRILRGVSLRIEPGQAVGLVGETGCGKSMTVRAVTGLLPRIGGQVTAGTVTVDGHDMTHASERQWRAHQGKTVALVPQASMSSLDPLMRVGKQLTETIRRADRRADVPNQIKRSFV